MRDDGASWKAQVQAGLKARQRVNACVQKLDASPDWSQVRTAFVTYFAVLEKLGQKVRAIPDRLQVLPDLLQRDVLAVPHWLELEKEESIQLVADLWQWWSTGALTTQYFQGEAKLRQKFLGLYNDAGGNAYENFKNYTIAYQLFSQGINYGKQFPAVDEIEEEKKWWATFIGLHSNAGLMIFIRGYEEEAAENQKGYEEETIQKGYEEEAIQLYHQGIAYGERCPEAVKNSSFFLNLLRNYSNLCNSLLKKADKKINVRTELNRISHQGTTYGERLLADSETNPEFQCELISLYNHSYFSSWEGLQSWFFLVLTLIWFFDGSCGAGLPRWIVARRAGSRLG